MRLGTISCLVDDSAVPYHVTEQQQQLRPLSAIIKTSNAPH